MKNLKKILIFCVLLAVVATFFVVSPTKSKIKSYYSGDAINYNGRVYIGTTNTGAFELFALENDSIYKKTTIVSTDGPLAKTFLDSKFVKEGARLYVYLVNGRYLLKYDISNPTTPKLTKKIKDNSWDWFVKVDIVNGNLITVGSKGIKVWNKEYQVVNAYAMVDEKDLGSITFSPSGDFMISTKDKVSIFSAASRDKVAEYTIASTDERVKRQTVNDASQSLIYVVDDESLKGINFSGQIKREFKHISNVGYDVTGSSDHNYIYFSDGIGVVKVRKSDFVPVDWVYTTRLGLPGSWAMGLKAVRDGQSEKIVVFNGSNILVLDKNMQAVSHYEATEVDLNPVEDLYLGVDKNRAPAGTDISIRGGGFGLEEELEIKIAKTTYTVTTSKSGRFQKIIAVPSVLPIRTDIKVTGKVSGRTYSIGFEIE